jgi:CBS domain-containing protein
MHVHQILRQKSNEVISATPTTTTLEAARILRERRIGALLVISTDGAVQGIVSERDVVRGIAENGASCLDWPISDLMTRRVKVCSPDDTIDQVMKSMTDGRFRHLPVMDSGRLVGLISIGDVVKYRIEEVEYEANAMRQYIAAS